LNVRRQIHAEFGLEIISTHSGQGLQAVIIRKLEIFDRKGERLFARNLYFKIVNCKVLNEVNEQVFNSDDYSPVIFMKSNEDYPCTIKFLFKTDRPIASVKIVNEKMDSQFDLVKKVRLSMGYREFFSGTLNIGINLLTVVVQSITGFRAEGEDQRSIDSINSLQPFEGPRKAIDENTKLSSNRKIAPTRIENMVNWPVNSHRVGFKESFNNDFNCKSNDNQLQNRKRKPVINKSLINLEKINAINLSKNTTTIEKDFNMPEISSSINKVGSHADHKDSRAQIKEITSYSNLKGLMQVAGRMNNFTSHKQLKHHADSSAIKDKAFFIQSLLKNVDFFRNAQPDADKPSTIKLNLKEKLRSFGNKPNPVNLFTSRVTPHKLLKIPVSPAGRTLSIEMYSNWGHLKYIGFAAIMVFDDFGEPVPICSHWISVQPESAIYHHTESLVKFGHSIKNSKNFRCKMDPSEPDQFFKVTIDLQSPKKLSAIRIANYLSSSIYSIGIKHLVLTLDEQVIFFGEASIGASNDKKSTHFLNLSSGIT